MAPRKTRNGASAATRRTASAGSRAASQSRTSQSKRTPNASARNSAGGKRTGGKQRAATSASTARTNPLATLLGATARIADVIPLRPEFAGTTPRRNTPHGGQGRESSKREPKPYWTLPVALLIALVIFAVAYYPVLRVQYREYRDRARLRAELVEIKARNARLDAEVARLRTPEGVEDYARTRLGLVKRGEHVVVVREDGVPAESSAATAVPQIDSDRLDDGPEGPWTAFLDLVFGVQ